MASEAWKAVERTVAALLGGVRAWETDLDVLVVTDSPFGPAMQTNLKGERDEPQHLLWLQKHGYIKLACVEVKNLTAPTVAQLEGYLLKNQEKIDRFATGATNALVIKRKAGPGRSTPYLLVMPLA